MIKNIMLLNNLAYLYSKKGDERALKLAKEAYQLSPESAGVLDTYGWILLQNNNNEQALSLLTKAARMLPNNAEVQYHYAAALHRTGNKDKARQIINQIIDSGRSYGWLDDAKALLHD